MKLVTIAEQAHKQKIKFPNFKQPERALLNQVLNLLEQFKRKNLVTQTQINTINKIIISITNN